MVRFRSLALFVLFVVGFQIAHAQNINLLPKYGSIPKNDVQKDADAKFLAGIDDYYKGDRKQAAVDTADRGWSFLRQGNPSDAMRRFNQAWLIDHENGSALWGMAVIQGGMGKMSEALKLLAEADALMGDDIDFSVDYAKALGIVGSQTKNESQLQDAFARFERLYQKAPQNTLNLQNWAITLFFVGNYAEAWKKVALAEATPRHAELDAAFIADLNSKMPRP